MRLSRNILGPAALAAVAACVAPVDRSDTLTVQFAAVGDLFRGDTLVPDVQLLDEGGNPVPNAEVQLVSSNDLVVKVDTGGFLIAVDSGMATVTARAFRFAETPTVEQTIRVHALLEVDSIVPARVGFGDTLNIFGVGLAPDLLFAVTLGETNLEVASFTPRDPADSAGFGTLSLWVGPPARSSEGLVVLTANGGFVLGQQIRVDQFDIFEPNDSGATNLGTIDAFVANPALAFEPRGRGDLRPPTDWYRFTTPADGDWTLGIGTPSFGRRILVLVADQAGWDGTNWVTGEFGLYPAMNGSWMVGPNANVCQARLLFFNFGGDSAFIPPLQFPSSGAIITLQDLPAGTYDLIAFYLGDGFPIWNDVSGRAEFFLEVNRDSIAQVQPVASELAIVPGVFSVVPPDQAEENDHCEVATPIALPVPPTELSIDNPHDVDWFSFTLNAPQNVRFSLSAADSLADLDMYVVRDVLPDSLVIEHVAFSAAAGGTIDGPLPAGDYFLIVVDFLGVATAYTLGGTVGPVPPGALRAPGRRASPDGIEKVRPFLDAARRAGRRRP